MDMKEMVKGGKAGKPKLKADTLGEGPAGKTTERVRELIERIKVKDKNIGMKAIYELEGIQDESAVPALVEALGDEQFPRRAKWRIAAALGLIGSPAALLALLDGLEHTDDAVRFQSVCSLGEHGDSIAVPGLIDLLERGDRSRIIIEAARILGRFGDPSAVPSLLKVLGERTYFESISPGFETKSYAAAEALGRIGDVSAMPELIRALDYAGRYTKARVAMALGELGDPSAVPALIRTVNQDDPVGGHAIDALAYLGGVPVLVFLQGNWEESVRSRSLEALKGIIDGCRTLEEVRESRTAMDKGLNKLVLDYLPEREQEKVESEIIGLYDILEDKERALLEREQRERRA